MIYLDIQIRSNSSYLNYAFNKSEHPCDDYTKTRVSLAFKL